MPIVINLKEKAYKKDENENLDNSVKITIQIKNELYGFRIEHEEIFKSKRKAVLTEFGNTFKHYVSDLTNHHMVFDCYPEDGIYSVLFNKYEYNNEIDKLVFISRKPEDIGNNTWMGIILDCIQNMKKDGLLLDGLIEFSN